MIGIGGTPFTEVAIRRAIELANLHNSTLTGVTVVDLKRIQKIGSVPIGAGLILIAEAVFYQEIGITLRALAAIVFLLLTAPVAAHLIGRAAYYSGIKRWQKTWIDQLKEFYPQKNFREDEK